MIKKLLLVPFLLIATIAFSQEKTISKLSAAPNPFVTNTIISFNTSLEKKTTLSIKNVLGKTVFRKIITAKKGKNSISFSKNNLQSGMYIYTIQNSKQIVSKRFVIK